MEFVTESLLTDWQALLRFAPRLIYALVLLVIFLVAARLIGRFSAGIFDRSRQLRPNKRFLQHVVTWAITGFGILLALGIMGFGGIVASLLATGGVVAIVLGFAFREIGENFLAGFFLTFSSELSTGVDILSAPDLKPGVDNKTPASKGVRS